MKRNLSIVLSLVLLGGIIIPAYAQTSDNVVINEVDINPPGNDAASVSEWVELYNPTDSDIDLGGWKIASTTVLKKTMTIPDGTIIEPGQFLTYSYQSVWFTDSNESVELRDESGVVVDKTPMIADIQNDFLSWQRIFDGFDSNSSSNWKFVTSTAGSSNGKLVETQTSEDVIVTLSSEKPSYLFGETAVLQGTVSEELFTVKPSFKPEPILMTISGPNYVQSLTLYPDLNLNFDTSLTLHQVLGINEGTYDVTVTYGGTTATTSFSVGFEFIEQEEKEDSFISIVTDKSQYIPGEFVSIIASTSEIIPFEGMKFSVIDSEGQEIASGNLFPTNGQFSTSVFVTNIDPHFGVYRVNAEYSDKSISATFEVIEDFKEDVPISLWTDKIAYGLGDEVKISGRLNQVWIGFLDLEIIQTKQTSLGTSYTASDSGFKILDGVRVMGDGSFEYSFIIPENELRLGDYRITVSKDIGTASKVVHAAINPDDFVVSDAPLTLNSEKNIYEMGETMTLSGFIKDPRSTNYETGIPVKISISTEDGSPLEIIGLPEGEQTLATGGIVVAYDFTAIPESSGSYSIDIDISKNIFSEGNYIATAEYLDNITTSTFSIIDPLALDEGAIISIDKEVYGLGETVHLTGILPPIGDRAVDISLTRPDGTVSYSGSPIDNQRFSWSWDTPITEKRPVLKIDEDERDVKKTNFGIYKIKVSTTSESRDFFFKVSPNPESDSLSKIPLFVTTEKTLYMAGDKLKVVGNVITRNQGDEGLVVPERVTIKVLDGTFPFEKIHESNVYPNQGGEFVSLFELPSTIFSEGTYTVKAIYSGLQTETTFGVTNDFVFGIDDPVSLLVYTDKSEFYPGDTVIISGKPNKLIYLEKYDISVIQKSENEINCGSFICGIHAGPVTSIHPSPSGAFVHEFTIPDSLSSIGSYEVTVDADFEIKSIQFDVVEKPYTPKLETIIEKENRIPEKTIPIFTEEKNTEDGTIAPRVVSGSLITPSRGDESNVNLKVSTVTGACIIGPDAECLVKESTRKPGQIYEVVQVDGISLNVRYSGPDARLEKFSILPESSTAFLPDANWNVEVLKDDQVSRFYYKVTYKTIE